jgi:prepilin signal peptidase PulO-like enzyme (type II secretory pathway)
MSEQVLIDIAVFFFGTIIGSFLNVCIVRLP